MLKPHGAILSEHIGDPNLSSYGETKMSDIDIYGRDMAWLMEADAVVAEVTTTSLGVGYELGMAEGMHKPVLALFRSMPEKRLSAMVSGNQNFTIFTYTKEDEVKDAIEAFFEKLGG